jgi:lysophospholipase L1-like esterase
MNLTGPLSVKRLLVVVFMLACTVFIANSVLLGVRVYRGVKIAQASKSFSVKPAVVKKRVLVIGDATGAGVGAKSPAESIAGRLSREFPYAEVRNLSGPGAASGEVLAQMDRAGNEGFDLVLIQAGSEDVIRLDDLETARGAYSRVLYRASALAPAVILVGVPDVGRAPAFFPPVSWLLSGRAASLRSLLILTAREKGAEYVDLFPQGGDEPLLKAPAKYFAADRLHPSGDGYALWYGEITRQSALQEALKAN